MCIPSFWPGISFTAANISFIVEISFGPLLLWFWCCFLRGLTVVWIIYGVGVVVGFGGRRNSVNKILWFWDLKINQLMMVLFFELLYLYTYYEVLKVKFNLS